MVTPGQKDREEEGDEEELEPDRATTYRALVARANYLAQDRTDIGYVVKELCRRMSAPRERERLEEIEEANQVLDRQRKSSDHDEKAEEKQRIECVGRHRLCRV